MHTVIYGDIVYKNIFVLKEYYCFILTRDACLLLGILASQNRNWDLEVTMIGTETLNVKLYLANWSPDHCALCQMLVLCKEEGAWRWKMIMVNFQAHGVCIPWVKPEVHLKLDFGLCRVNLGKFAVYLSYTSTLNLSSLPAWKYT